MWDTNFGGEMDAVRYRATRVTFVANYQAMLGEQFRAFDPNQGNYILSGELATRVAGIEVGPVFYHQSRHLSDRFKRQAVDWNMLGGMVGTTVEQGPTRVDARADLRGTVQRTYVDYTLGAGHARPDPPAAEPARRGRGRWVCCAIWAWTGRRIAGGRPGSVPTPAWVSRAGRAPSSSSWPWSAESTRTSSSSAPPRGPAWACGS